MNLDVISASLGGVHLCGDEFLFYFHCDDIVDCRFQDRANIWEFTDPETGKKRFFRRLFVSPWSRRVSWSCSAQRDHDHYAFAMEFDENEAAILAGDLEDPYMLANQDDEASIGTNLCSSDPTIAGHVRARNGSD